MCGELLRQAERYTSEGLHPRIITDGYDIARDAAIEFLESFKVPVNSDSNSGNKYDRELMTCIAATSLKTKLDHDLADAMTHAIVDAILCVAPEDDRPVDLNMIEVMTMERKMGTDSRFVNGLVLDHGGRHPDMPKVLKNCHVMTCNVTFEYEKTEVQSGFFYSSAEEREKLVESERKWLDERCKAVIDFKRSVCKEGEVRILILI
jgi:T-complex protein 1 subunit zeta